MFARPLLAFLCWLLLASPIAAPAALAPALWVARDGDTTVWLFGTMHQLRAGMPWLTGPVAKAFAESDVLTLEIAPVTPEAMTQALVAVTPVKPAPLPPELDRRLRKRAHELGFPAQAFDATDPWFAATTLAAQPPARAGYSPAPAPETLLARLADRSGTAIEPLETLDGQLDIFAALPQPAQRAMLTRVLDDPDPVQTMDRIVAAWGRGDVTALDRLLANDMDAAGPAVRGALLDRRNAAWARTIGKWMRQPGTRFVAVGAGHLAGPDSVQARLQAMGVAVQRVQ